MKRTLTGLLLSVLLGTALSFAPVTSHAAGSFIGPLSQITTVSSTIPANGDLNPYGVAVVPHSSGKLIQGDVLISNFNNSANQQGTGTTIVEISPTGQQMLFSQINAATLPGSCPGGVGLTTALVALRAGWVIVGSLPTTNGMSATAKAGCLIVLDNMGRPVETFSGSLINGPWDMTAYDLGYAATLFVTNVLNGTVAADGNTVNMGTVVRIVLRFVTGQLPQVASETVVGTGFPERTDPAALVIGPTGVGINRFNGTVYVADTLGNRIAAIPDALNRVSPMPNGGLTVSTGGALNGPLGLIIAPNGNIVTVNSNDGNAVETAPNGVQVAVKALDTTGTPPGAGTLFGLAATPNGRGLYFVDDGTNTLNLLH